MAAISDISDMPKRQTSLRENEMLMEFMRFREDTRTAEQNLALETAVSKDSLLETALKGALMDKTG